MPKFLRTKYVSFTETEIQQKLHFFRINSLMNQSYDFLKHKNVFDFSLQFYIPFQR